MEPEAAAVKAAADIVLDDLDISKDKRPDQARTSLRPSPSLS